MSIKNIVLVSGGLDSATVLAMAVKEYGKENVVALHTNYGAPTEEKELECTLNLCGRYGVGLVEKDIRNIIAKGGLTEEGKDFTVSQHENKVSTGYVPFRNLMLITIAASLGATVWPENGTNLNIWTGPQKSDVEAYADCRPEFIQTAEKALNLTMDDREVKIITPLLELDKEQVVRKALYLEVPIELTYSCYRTIDGKPCRTCGACEERIGAFKKIGVEDPVYA